MCTYSNRICKSVCIFVFWKLSFWYPVNDTRSKIYSVIQKNVKKYDNNLKLIKANILPWKRNMEHRTIYSKSSLSTANKSIGYEEGGLVFREYRNHSRNHRKRPGLRIRQKLKPGGFRLRFRVATLVETSVPERFRGYESKSQP